MGLYTYYEFDDEGYFTGSVESAEQDVAGQTLVAPDLTLTGLQHRWDGTAWQAEALEQPEQPEVPYDVARRVAYQNESDPLFFEWQRGEATEQDWLDAVQAVKDAHPYPEPV